MGSQAAHAAHILFIRDRMNNRARTKEQQCLEKSVREQVKNTGTIGPDAQRHEHVTELGAGRIGDHPA